MNAVETCKKILIFPDVDAYDYWKEKFKARPKLEIYISDYLQKTATEEDLNNHIDIADWLMEECLESLEKDFLRPGPSLFSIMGKTLKKSNRRTSLLDDEIGIECGTPLVNAVLDAVDNYHAGRPVVDGITVDEVEVTIMDDWAETGCTFDDNGPVPIYAPLILVHGESKPKRLFQPTDIDGFTPERGYEYQMKIRRFFLTNNPFYHQFELIELIKDTKSP